MAEAIPDSKGDYRDIEPASTRAELTYLLASAFELEHRLACTYLFAAYALKNDVSEGGLTTAQAEMVRRWRRNLAAVGTNRIRNLIQIEGMLTAIGGSVHVTRPTPPTLIEINNVEEGDLRIEPFSLAIIERLREYEHQHALIVPTEQAVSVDTRFEGGETFFDYTTNGALYAKIEKSFRALSAENLFVGAPALQVNARFLKLGAKIVATIDRESALAAITTIVSAGRGETATGADVDQQSYVCDTIYTEYTEAVIAAQQGDAPFEPVRPVVQNPRTQFKEEEDGAGTQIADPLTHAVAELFNRAYDTLLDLLAQIFADPEESGVKPEQRAEVIARLFSTVIRPLGEALTRMPVDAGSLAAGSAGAPFGDRSKVAEHTLHEVGRLDERIWELTTTVTRLRVAHNLPAELLEATAGLQDLTYRLAAAQDAHEAEVRLAELKQMQAELAGEIQAETNGPYLATNIETLKNWLGESTPTRPQVALCRCGASASKPFCDGTHARIDFSTQKDPKRVPDQRDTYAGTAVTVFDNRGICAHSGFCTDRLASAFHAGKEPFVTPSGARMDEIIRAVRSCPSGALSYALGGVEARDQVDQERPPAIEVSKDGPYRVTGCIPLKDGDGRAELRNTGASTEHYSLCRCGHSQNKPFCSGMHWYVNFHDPVAGANYEPSLFEWAGGLPALTRVAHLFYDKYVPQDPLLQSLFSRMAADHPERVAAWLSEVFGGPDAYSGTYGGYSRMLSQHVGKMLTEAQRARWVSLLCQAADEAGLPADAEFRSAFASYIEWGSRLAVENSASGAHPPLHMPMPHWDWGTAGPPMSRVSALAPVVEETMTTLPEADEPLHFAEHIKMLFRQMDRQSMKWAFDLWSYHDVAAHAEGILQRLQNGSMPCDGAWSSEKIGLFQRWIEAGKPE